MSLHYSKYLLNSYWSTEYFRAHIPDGYQVGQTLQKCRAFRQLPPRLRELATKSKKWAELNGEPTNGIDRYYDDDGNELDPDTSKPLTDKQIDAQWGEDAYPDFEVEDIPLPPGGFPDPKDWEPPEPEEEPDESPDERPTEADLLRDIEGWGRERVAKDYGVPLDDIDSDEELAWAIIEARG